MSKVGTCVNHKFNEYSNGVPSWNGSLRNYYRDFLAGKVGQEVKVQLTVAGEQTEALTVKQEKEAKSKVQQWLRSVDGKKWVAANKIRRRGGRRRRR